MLKSHSILKKLLIAASAASGLLFGGAASAAYQLAWFDTTWTFTVLDSNSFRLDVTNLASTTTTDWVDATHIQSIAFKGLGIDFSGAGISATLTSSPAGATAWNDVVGELNANGCPAVDGNPDQSICFTGVPPLGLANVMSFTVDVAGASLDIEDAPHVKVQMVQFEEDGCNSRGQRFDCWVKVGSLLSQDLPGDSNGNGNGGAANGNGNGNNVPEPATLALVGLGLLGAASMRRRRRA